MYFSLELKKKSFTGRFCIMSVSVLLARTLNKHCFVACAKPSTDFPYYLQMNEVTPVMLQ